MIMAIRKCGGSYILFWRIEKVNGRLMTGYIGLLAVSRFSTQTRHLTTKDLPLTLYIFKQLKVFCRLKGYKFLN